MLNFSHCIVPAPQLFAELELSRREEENIIHLILHKSGNYKICCGSAASAEKYDVNFCFRL